jgi:hypothetical protein
MIKSFVLAQGFRQLSRFAGSREARGFSWALDIGAWDFTTKAPSFGRELCEILLGDYRQEMLNPVQTPLVAVPE